MKKRISLLIAMIMALTLVVVAFAAIPASAESTYIERATTVATDTDVIATVYAGDTDVRGDADKVIDVTLGKINANEAHIGFTDRNNDVSTNPTTEKNITRELALDGKYIWVEFNKYIINFEKSPGSSHGLSFYVAEGKKLYINGNGAILNFSGTGGGGRAMTCELASGSTGTIIIDNLDINSKTADNGFQVISGELNLNNCNVTTNGANGFVNYGGGTVNLNAGTTVSGTLLSNRGAGAIYNINSGATVGKIAVSSGSTVNVAGGTVNGTVTVSDGSANAPAFNMTAGNVNGSLTVNSGAFASVSGGTVNGNVTVSGGSASAPAFNMAAGTINGNVTVNAGAYASMSGGTISNTTTALNVNGVFNLSGTAKITMNSTATWDKTVALNDGANAVLNMSGGTIENASAPASASGSIGMAINVYQGTLNISGGKVLKTSGNATCHLINIAGNGSSKSVISMTGGEVDAKSNAAFYVRATTTTPDITISGGTINAGTALGNSDGASSKANVTISGGTINGAVNCSANMPCTISGTVGGNITLKGRAYTVGTGTTLSGAITVDGATLTLAGGTIKDGVVVNGGSASAPAFKITSGTLEKKAGSSWREALAVKDGGFAEIAGGTIESDNCPLHIYAGGTVNMTGGTVQTRSNNNGTAVDGTLVMSGGSIRTNGGSRAIVIRSGATGVTISGGTINGTDSIHDDSASGTIRISGTASLTGIKTGANTKVYITGGTLSKSIYGSGTCYVGDANTAYTINSNLTVECTNTEIRNVTINGTVTPNGGTVNIYDTIVMASGKALALNNGKNVTVYAEDSTFETSGGIAVHVNAAVKLTLKDCTLRSRLTGGESSALRVQDFTFDKNENGVDLYKGYVNVTGGTIENYGSHPAVLFFRGAVINLTNVDIKNHSTGGGIASFENEKNNQGAETTNNGKKNYVTVNGGTITTGAGAAVSPSDKDDVLVISNATLVSSNKTGVVNIVKASEVTLNDCTVKSAVQGENAGSAVYMASSATGSTLTINGGTYISDARPVIRTWATPCTFNLNGAKIYSTGTWSDAYWAFGFVGNTTGGTRDNWVAFVRSPKGSADQYTGGQFNVASAESSVVINGETYYVYTGAKGGAPVSKGGASVRIEGTDAGLRFTSYISIKTINAAEAAKKAGTTVEYGTAIFPTDLIEAAGLDTFDPLALEAKGYTVAWVVADEGQTAVKDANDNIKGYTVRAALVGIKESHYDWEYSAIAYIKYTNADGEDVYLFGNYSEADNSRSIVEVADAALKDLSDTRGGKDGKHIYKVVIEGETKYSPYTAKQRAILESYLPIWS